jgi:hypothetical protein
MWSRRRALLQLLRALIACAALVLTVQAPALAAVSARDPISWVAAPAPMGAQAPARAPAARRKIQAAPVAPPPVDPAPRAAAERPRAALQRCDARYLYLEIQQLLC